MDRRFFAAALGVAACLCAGMVTPALAGVEVETVPFAGGFPGGFYQEVVNGVAAAVPGIEPVETKGSEDNLALLEDEDKDSEVRFALAQQDVVAEHFRNQKAGKPSHVRVVGRVFYDYLHIFVRSPLHIERASDFRLFRVWPGAEGSGTRRTAEHFLESVGVPLSLPLDRPATDDVPSPTTIENAQELFASRGLDVAMIVAVPGSDQACKFMASGRASLFPLDYQTSRILTSEAETSTFHRLMSSFMSTINILARTHPASEAETSPFQRQISIANIPAHTYAHQARAVPTVAVAVLLLAREGEDPEIAARVLEAARHTWSSLAGTQGDAGCRRLARLPPGGSLAAANLEMLDGVKEPESPSQRSRLGLGLVLVLVVAGFAAGVLRLWRSGLLREGWSLLRKERAGARILAGLALSAALITFLTYVFEHRINEHFSTPWESAWSITIYLFSGLEDRNPYTPEGRLVAALGLVLGPVFFALMTGWLAGVFIRWEKRMPQNLRNHVLLVNWNDRAVRIVQELHNEVLTGADGAVVIVVLTNDDGLTVKKLKESGVGAEGTFEDVYVTVGDPTSERALRNANAQDARSIVLLADAHLEQADALSLRTLVTLRRIARDEGKDDMHVVVELADPGNTALVEDMAEDFPGLLEWVSGVQVRTGLLAQATLSRGVTAFYRELLHVSGDTNEVYTVKLPASARGSTFRDYAAKLLALNGKQPLIPVGVQRRHGGHARMFTNPRPGEPGWTLEEGDLLVVLSHEPPDPAILPA